MVPGVRVMELASSIWCPGSFSPDWNQVSLGAPFRRLGKRIRPITWRLARRISQAR